MALPKSNEFSAVLVVLGLIIQQPDTIAGIGLELEKEFPSTRWPGNIVHSSLDSLLKSGYVRKARSGSARGLEVYEASAEGTQHFHGELHKSGPVLPGLRDALRMRLRFIRTQEDLEIIINDFRDHVKLCLRESEAARSRYRIARQEGLLASGSEQDICQLGQAVSMAGEVRYWQKRAKEYETMCRALEDPLGREDTLDDEG
jgi:hypothetical protein